MPKMCDSLIHRAIDLCKLLYHYRYNPFSNIVPRFTFEKENRGSVVISNNMLSAMSADLVNILLGFKNHVVPDFQFCYKCKHETVRCFLHTSKLY